MKNLLLVALLLFSGAVFAGPLNHSQITVLTQSCDDYTGYLDKGRIKDCAAVDHEERLNSAETVVVNHEARLLDIETNGGIVGPEGPQGPVGPAGADGIDGQDGADGTLDPASLALINTAASDAATAISVANLLSVTVGDNESDIQHNSDRIDALETNSGGGEVNEEDLLSYRVNLAYFWAFEAIREEMRQLDASIQSQQVTRADVSFQYDSNDDWVNFLNSRFVALAPNGVDNAFADAPDDTGGVVGIFTTGSIASNDLEVFIQRPAYGVNAPVQIARLAWVDVIDDHNELVNMHFVWAVDSIERRLSDLFFDIANGITTPAQASVDTSGFELQEYLENNYDPLGDPVNGPFPAPAASPVGAQAFEEGGGNDANGTVGIEVSGTIAGGDLQVSVHRSRYGMQTNLRSVIELHHIRPDFQQVLDFCDQNDCSVTPYTP